MNLFLWFDSLSENTKISGIGGSCAGMITYFINIKFNDSFVDFMIVLFKSGIVAAFGGFMTLVGKWLFEKLFKKSNPKL